MFQQEIQNSFTIKIKKNDKPKSLKSFALASKVPAIKRSNFSPVFPKIKDLIDDDICKEGTFSWRQKTLDTLPANQ